MYTVICEFKNKWLIENGIYKIKITFEQDDPQFCRCFIIYNLFQSRKQLIFFFLTAPQTDTENKGIDKNEVEEKSSGKSDDNLDNRANNDEDKLNDKNDDKNQNELLNI